MSADKPIRYNGYRFYVDHSLMDDPELNDNILIQNVDDKVQILNNATKEIATDEY